MSTTPVEIPESAGRLPGDLDDESSPPVALTGILPDMRTAADPLPSVAGLSGREMEALLGTKHDAMKGAVLNWSNAGGGYPTHAAEHGLDPTDPAYLGQLAKSEDAAIRAAEDVRRHAQAIADATERAGVTLPDALQAQAASRFAILQSQSATLPLPTVLDRLRAALLADDAVAMSLLSDLLPARLDAAKNSASHSERGAAKELGTLLAKVNAQLREKYADPATLALHKRAVELRAAAGSARAKASKRRMTERTRQRMAANLQRIGMGTLVPVTDPKTGQPAVDDHGTPLLKRWDESDADFFAGLELDRERERYFRSRGTFVVRP